MGTANALVRIGFKLGLVYRFDFFIGMIRIPLTLLIYYFLWKSIYAYTGTGLINRFTFTGLITYYVISMIVGIFAYSSVDEWMEEEVVDGEVVSEVLRPVSYIARHFYVERGFMLLALFLEAIPAVLIAVIFFNLFLPSMTNGIAFAFSVIFASILIFLLTFIVGMSAFWLKKIQGMRRVKRAVVAFLDGTLLPLTFFPIWAQAIANYLPFQHMRFVPVNIYLGKYTLIEVGKMLAIQCLWIIVLFVLAIVVWKQAYKRIVGVGT